MLPLFAGDIMKLTFIYHSSFAVELENCVLVFDYYGEGDVYKRQIISWLHWDLVQF